MSNIVDQQRFEQRRADWFATMLFEVLLSSQVVQSALFVEGQPRQEIK